MTLYTSVKSGDFNDPTTWGSAGWPSLAGDTFIIASGHNVRLNDVHTHELGSSTINAGGTLYVNHLTNTELRFYLPTTHFYVNGNLKLCGLNNEPVSSSNTCTLALNTTSDGVYGIYCNSVSSSIVTSGASDFVGNPIAVMKNTWSSGKSFTISGDYTQGENIWRVGQKVVVHKFTSFVGYNSDVQQYTIASLQLSGSDTIVTISEAAPSLTFNMGGVVLNVSRNVIIKKVGALEGSTQFNTNRPRAYTAFSNLYININFTEFIGFFGFGGFNSSTLDYFTINNSVFRNGLFTLAGAWYGISRVYVNKSIFCNNGAQSFTGELISVNDSYICGALTIFSGLVDSTITNCVIYSGQYIFSSNIYNTTFKNCYIFSNYGILYGSSNKKIINTSFGISPYGVECKNTYDLINNTNVTYFNKSHLINCSAPTGGFIMTGRNTSSPKGIKPSCVIYSSNHNKVLDAHYRYEQYGDVIKNTSIKKQNSLTSAEVIPLSNCSTFYGVPILEWKENNVPATPQIRIISIKGEGWSTFPTSAELYIQAISVSSDGYTEINHYSPTVLTDNTNWKDFTISFTPLRKDTVIYKVWLNLYSASCKIYVDEFLQRPNYLSKHASWSEAELKLEFDYDDWQNSESWS